MEKNAKLIPLITGLFVATLLIANTLDTKIFQAFGLDLPAGIIVFPLAYLFGDVLTEVYGYATARRTIWIGFASLLLMLVSYEAARHLEPAAFWPNQEAFDAVFSHVPRIVLASVAAYFCGEFTNSYILAKMKLAQEGHHMGLRFILSTIGGQAVDTTVFVVIAFWGTMPLMALGSIILSGWAVKVAWEVLALPLTLPVVRLIKRIEQTDVFDTQTNFNPLKMS